MSNGDEFQRRQADTVYVDKTMRVTTTLGFFITVIAAVWFIGRYTDDLDDENTAIRAEAATANAVLVSEIHLMQDEIGRIFRTQEAYIEARNDQHNTMDETMEQTHHDMAVFREAWAVRFSERLP